MQSIGQIPLTLDEALAQITEILARGYRRYKKNSRLGSDTKCRADMTQAEESGLCTPLLQKSEGSRAKAPGVKP